MRVVAEWQESGGDAYRAVTTDEGDFAGVELLAEDLIGNKKWDDVPEGDTCRTLEYLVRAIYHSTATLCGYSK